MTDDFALADESGGKLRIAALLAGRASKDEAVAAVLDDGIGCAFAVSARDLRNGADLPETVIF